MTVAFMRALVDRDLAAAEAEVGATVPADLPDILGTFLQYRLAQLDADPSIRQWLGRTMVWTDADGGRHVIGSIGFHGPPDDRGRVEIGYSVVPEHRRQGIAREAAAAMFAWAHETHGINRFIASIAPENEPSLRLARGFGFVQTGSQVDDEDGLELILEADWPMPDTRRG